MDKGYISVTERPDLYDWFYSEQVEDIPMYSSLAKDHSVVLECGIGSGRIAIPLAEKGKIVFGIDNSPEMLLKLQKRLNNLPELVRTRIHAFQMDMRGFDLRQKFSFIFIPFSTFNYLLTIDDQKAALSAARNHLLKDGVLVLELLSFSLFPNWLDNDTTIKKVARRVDPETQRIIEMWRVIRFDSVTQIVEQDRHFRFYNANGALENETVVLWRNRFFFIGEMQLLLEAAGFEIKQLYGDCTFGPYNHKSEFVVVVAKQKTKL